MCNLCGSTRLVEASRSDRYGYPAALRVCARCGLGFLSPRLTVGSTRASTSPPTGRSSAPTTGGGSTPRPSRTNSAPTPRSSSLPRASLPGHAATVLDVGGSTGVVAGASGTPSAGRPPCSIRRRTSSPSAAEGMETIAASRRTSDLGGRTFDLMLLCQTIDHLLDVAATLRSLRGRLPRTAALFVDVLDVDFMVRRVGSIEAAVKIDHPFSLTRATALAYFELSGPRAGRRAAFRLTATGASCSPRWSRSSRTGRRSSSPPRAFLAELWRLRAERPEDPRRRPGARRLAAGPAEEPRRARRAHARAPRSRHGARGRLLRGGRALAREDAEILARGGGLSTWSRSTGPPSSRPTTRSTRSTSSATRSTSSSRTTFDAVAVVQATSPFTAPEDLAGAVALLEHSGAASVVSVVTRRGRPAPTQAEAARRRPAAPVPRGGRPDAVPGLPELWMRNGSVYLSAGARCSTRAGCSARGLRAVT